MRKQSSGILLYRIGASAPEVLLVHPGGPFFRNKDKGSWTIPKGELLPGEDPLTAALREFQEETGYLPEGDAVPLTAIVQKGGKEVLCWAVSGDFDAAAITSNTFALEWPPKSQKMVDFPEIDQARWFSLTEAAAYINERQRPFLDELSRLLLSFI